MQGFHLCFTTEDRDDRKLNNGRYKQEDTWDAKMELEWCDEYGSRLGFVVWWMVKSYVDVPTPQPDKMVYIQYGIDGRRDGQGTDNIGETEMKNLYR